MIVINKQVYINIAKEKIIDLTCLNIIISQIEIYYNVKDKYNNRISKYPSSVSV